jgi:hypothetical protein
MPVHRLQTRPTSKNEKRPVRKKSQSIYTAKIYTMSTESVITEREFSVYVHKYATGPLIGVVSNRQLGLGQLYAVSGST